MFLLSCWTICSGPVYLGSHEMGANMHVAVGSECTNPPGKLHLCVCQLHILWAFTVNSTGSSEWLGCHISSDFLFSCFLSIINLFLSLVLTQHDILVGWDSTEPTCSTDQTFSLLGPSSKRTKALNKPLDLYFISCVLCWWHGMTLKCQT